MTPSQYVKAIVAAVVAAGGTAVTALTDGTVTAAEGVAIIVSAATAFGAVYTIPNAPSADPTTSTPDVPDGSTEVR